MRTVSSSLKERPCEPRTFILARFERLSSAEVYWQRSDGAAGSCKAKIAILQVLARFDSAKQRCLLSSTNIAPFSWKRRFENREFSHDRKAAGNPERSCSCLLFRNLGIGS